MDKSLVEKMVRNVVIRSLIGVKGVYYVPIAVSNRHVHLSQEDIEKLFGKEYELTKIRELSQPKQYVCKEKITVVGPKGKIEGIRVLGPPRVKTQVEISKTDSFVLGVRPPVRMSGDLEGTMNIKLIGPKGEVEIKEGLIIAARHLHLSEEEAKWYGVKNGEKVKVKKAGERGIIFSEVIARVGDRHSLEVHIDTDEANAAEIKNGELVLLEKT